ncbi:hypothetical protein C1I95_25795 [Micromonospora craterilacus]|uniref:Uncharacterized protein n=1 Tax=Micromonospora craterilacus TaxID=1655439 RepID=A0A2W2FA35_9ACTN|nr:hypothetical protein [Micromonospora craterilacus]PZG12464.1 hypothetical protein C1I95_25795 [Micromonospora craterilacus]
MIGWVLAHAPGAYVIGSVGVAVGGGILLHLAVEWRRVILARREAQARYEAARTAARGRHPAYRQRRPGRLVRAIRALSTVPAPRVAPDQQPWTAASAASWPLPLVYGDTVPAQRCP